MNVALAASAVIASALALLVPLQDAPKPPAAPAAPQERPRGEGRGHHEEHDEGETPLAEAMEKIEHAEHFLRRSIGDAAQDGESLKRIAEAQQAILTAKLLHPKMTASLPEAEQAKFLSGYRHEIAGLLIEFTNLERALLNGDRDAAKASYKKLHAMEESGHSEFTDGG
ncbi:MAG: hypothetical protein JNL90_03940 [Planctomycetes bacterium]|nr:hypothetical protein [Planctomycetota bacterium]